MNYIQTHWLIAIGTILILIAIAALEFYMLKVMPRHMTRISAVLMTLIVLAIFLCFFGYLFIHCSSYSLEAVFFHEQNEEYTVGQVTYISEVLSLPFSKSLILRFPSKFAFIDGTPYYFLSSAPAVGDWVSIVSKGPRNVVLSYQIVTEESEKSSVQYTIKYEDDLEDDNRTGPSNLSRFKFVSSCVLALLFCIMYIWGGQITRKLQNAEPIIPGEIHYSRSSGLFGHTPYFAIILVLFICSFYEKQSFLFFLAALFVWGYSMHKTASTSVRFCGNTIIVTRSHNAQRIPISAIDRTSIIHRNANEYVYVIYLKDGTVLNFESRFYTGIESFNAQLQHKQQVRRRKILKS